jgi:predicted O-methyltransferase YrrM
MKWIDKTHLEIGDTHFLLTIDRGDWKANESDADRFILAKTKWMVESLASRAPDRVDNIVDLGIFKGGSVALFHELFSPKHLVGIDREVDRVDALDQFIARHTLGDVVHLYYGTSQDDRARLTSIVHENFGDEPLDLVVDDCSHMYEQTKASLDILLPRLREGGLYLIEDWAWAHWPAEHWQGATHQFAAERTPLSKLILELAMVVGSRPGLIREMNIQRGSVYLTRGKEVVSDPRFDISEAYLTAGRTILNECMTGPGWPNDRRAGHLVRRALQRWPSARSQTSAS